MTANTDRYDATLDYINRFVHTGLVEVIKRAAQQANLTPESLGGLLSLKGHGYGNNLLGQGGTQDQHRAVRALLLCQRLFLQGPYAKNKENQDFNYNAKPDLPKTHFKGKTEFEVKKAINCYMTLPSPSCGDLAKAAESMDSTNDPVPFETLTRDSNPFPLTLICFDALRYWLFRAGFTSMRWLSSTSPDLTAQRANDTLGYGTVVQPENIDTIPRGYIWNFHDPRAKAVCHWGVSLGGGVAAAANTTPGAGKSEIVKFRSGNMSYGKFKLRASYEVCTWKYPPPNEAPMPVTIRQIDPLAVNSYF